MQQGNNNPMMGDNMGNMMPSDLTKQLPNVIGLAVLCLGLTTTVGSLQGGGSLNPVSTPPAMKDKHKKDKSHKKDKKNKDK